MAIPPPHPHEPEPRLPACDTAQLRSEWRQTLARIPGEGLKGEGFPHNVLGQLMHSPELLGPFLEWWVTAKSAMALSVREQELVILRLACLYNSDYVWKHHVPVGREFGIEDPELAALRRGDFTGFAVRERALLELSEQMLNLRTVTPSCWAEFGRDLQPRELIDLIGLVAQYVLFALTNNVLQVPLEPPLADEPGLGQA